MSSWPQPTFLQFYLWVLIEEEEQQIVLFLGYTNTQQQKNKAFKHYGTIVPTLSLTGILATNNYMKVP